MQFRMDQLLRSLSLGLDAVESELTGNTTNHGKRVAVLTAAMGRRLGWNDGQTITIAACSLLHDNALTESLAETKARTGAAKLLASHCVKGERNASNLPFPSDAQGFITCHHEYMDGSGPFGICAEQTPVGAQLIAIADHFDIEHAVKDRQAGELPELRAIIKDRRGSYYTPCAADALLEALDEPLLLSLKDACIDHSYAQVIPAWQANIHADDLMKIAKVVAAITDYKSEFTAKHSMRIADRCYWMSRFYQFDRETCAKVYLAAAVHDIGKLVTPVEILEKPGKLTEEEFKVIQQHVYWSYLMLKDIEGFDEICRWAVCHHRKLTGTGYPELPGAYLELDFVSRLMACIDIYQAVREARPYHPPRTHRETMEIMWEMAGRGEIDRQITADLDVEMARMPDADGEAEELSATILA